MPRRRPAPPTPKPVLAAMKAGGKGKHIFGEAEWWGKELFGIDNALVGNWPVVVIEDGKAKIKQYKSIPDWWGKHKDLLIKHMTALESDVLPAQVGLSLLPAWRC